MVRKNSSERHEVVEYKDTQRTAEVGLIVKFKQVSFLVSLISMHLNMNCE